MYLSKLVLHPESPQVTRELSDPYEMHRTIMRAFPSSNDGGPGRVLFRVDLDTTTGIPSVLVQSEKHPNWSFLPPTYLLPIANNPAFKEYAPSFRQGQRLRFLLRANPTIRRIFQTGKPGKRVGLEREEDQRAWLERKAQIGGFAIEAVRIIPIGKILTGKHPKPGIHLGVDYMGILTVTDPNLFTNSLQRGIGSAKGFGFGLLSVAPVIGRSTCS